MKKIFSKKHPSLLLHMIYKKEDIIEGRTDVAPANQFIQVSSLNLPKGKTFRPHKHIWKTPSYKQVIAQESWCIISGKVKVIFYDVNNEKLTEEVISAGDISITFEGGHNYEILEENSIIYEYKTGPYEGQQKDKVFVQ